MPSLNLSQDYLVIDDPITIGYSVKTAEGVWAAPVSVTYAQRAALNENDFTKSPALLQKTATGFNLWTAQLGGIVPKLGDQITDNTGLVWYVEHVDYCDRDGTGVQRYRCLVTEWVQ